jgi:RNA polymerase sigma factor (sigma-70 family)
MEKKYLEYNGEKVFVSEYLFYEYMKMENREKYLVKRSKRNEQSYEVMEENGVLYDKLNIKQISAEDQFIQQFVSMKLREALKCLTKEEFFIIKKFFYCEMTIRDLAERLKKPKSTVHHKKDKILKKLRGVLEIDLK